MNSPAFASETSIVPPSETPALDSMPRADLPAIWEGFQTQLASLKTTAETLTVTDVSQKAEMKLARQTRLTLKDLRVAIEKRRKELKEDALRRGQEIDNAARRLRDLIEPLETRLLEQEEYAERKEAKRKAELANVRYQEIRPYLNGEASVFNLGEMPDDQYTALLSGLKQQAEQRAADALKVDEERQRKEQEEAAERLRVSLENAKLKREAEKRERQIAAERERVAAEQRAAAEAARKEREAIEAKARAEREAAEKARLAEEEKRAAEIRAFEAEAKREREAIELRARMEREQAERKAAEERAAREKVERELREKQQAEEAAKRAAALAAKKAAAAPDRDKLAAYLDSIESLALPNFATDDGKAIGRHLAGVRASFINSIVVNLAQL